MPYFTLDDAAVLGAAIADPTGFVAGLPERVILDEVQRAPELFPAIKASVDKKRTPGRFLLTGSAHALVLPKASESLAGRMEVLTLWPFSQGEIGGYMESFVDDCFAASFSPKVSGASSWPQLVSRILMGGFPEPSQRKDIERRNAWFASYITTLLERDVRDLSNIAGLRELPRLLKLMSARAMGVLNFAGLAHDAGMSQTTLKRYWALLEAVFLVQLIDPWHANLGLRLVKSPKIAFPDTGLLSYLLGLDADALTEGDLFTGPLLETFVTSEIRKQLTWSATRATMYHYRTHTGYEVDLVLEDPKGRLVGIEIKKTASPTASDFNGLRHLKEQTPKRFLRGLLLYTGSTVVPFANDLFAIPISLLWHPAQPTN